MSKKNRKKSTRKVPVKRVKKEVQPKIGKYLNLEYESFCELSLLYFAEELIRLGYVAKVERSPSYSLCDPVMSSYAIQLKTKGSKQDTQVISKGVTYTPDYDIYFTEKALGIFCWDLGSGTKWDKNLLVAQKIVVGVTVTNGGPNSLMSPATATFLYRACCEVKPDFSRNSTTPKSVQSMKWLFQRHGVFVNLFRPNRIFEGLFVPEKYRTTERGTPRLLKFRTRNIQQYLKLKQ